MTARILRYKPFYGHLTLFVITIPKEPKTNLPRTPLQNLHSATLQLHPEKSLPTEGLLPFVRPWWPSPLWENPRIVRRLRKRGFRPGYLSSALPPTAVPRYA